MAHVIADRFEIERLVGSGGMGEVFRARDRLTGGSVAVKVMHGSMTRDLDRFRREALILAEVSHPRIVKYVAHGVSAEGRAYLAMEWLDGEDLSDRLERRGLSRTEALTLARRVAEALAVLHDRGIIHRDIKPSNLFLVNGNVDQLKVLDLGVARMLNASRPSTRSGVMVGTPGYMAPEQARGNKEVDARADVFSLGCVVFECLAGRPAFAGDNMAALLAKILLASPPSLRDCDVDVPPALDDLVTRMLAKHPSARPANGSAVLRELDPFAALSDAPAQRPSMPQVRALTTSERRLVSIVMASLGEGPHEEPAPLSTGADTMAASFDPRSIVVSFGGEAEMLADGSIVVTLSGKGSAGDQAAHAARCALALRSHLVAAPVALATGLATVTGKSAVGEVIERAAAILMAARGKTGRSEETMGGQSPVFLDETTAGLLDMRFDVGGDERGLFIRGLREREATARTLLGKPTPFVGRDRELATLLGIVDEAIGEPVARAVLVTGAPGAGKSRLLSELLHRVRDAHPAEVWIARGDPMSDGSPFSLLARLLRRAAGISGGEPLVARQQKLRARIGRHVRESEVTRVAEFIGEIASVPFPDAESVQLRAARQDAILMGDQMRRAFSDLIAAESSATPLLVVLEDLHWGDLPSVTFIDSALRTASERPFIVVAAARSEVREQFPHLWEQRSVQEIRLGPLVRRAAETLVREALGPDVSADEIAKLLDRAAGNAFYLEELIRSYASATDVSSLPGTVLAMVEARLERLDPMARRVLRAASIFGEIFWRGGVLALTGGDYKATEVDDWLAELEAREIVQRREISRFPSEQEMQFRHGLVRDAAYQMLTAPDRTLGHKLAGEWLGNAGEHEAMLLAEHFERGGLPDEAITHYVRATIQALEGNDFAQAEVRASRAIEAGARGADLGQLELLLAEASRWKGDHGAALAHARAAMGQLARGSDAWHSAAAEAVEATSTLGHAAETHEITRAIAGSETMTPACAVAMGRVVPRLVHAGAFDDADAMIARIDRDAKEILAVDPAARAFFFAARVARAKWRGEIESAATLAKEAVACFEELGDVRNAAVQRDNAGFAFVQLGAFTLAEPLLRETIEAADHLGLAGVANEARLHLGQLCARTMRKDDAVKLMKEVIAGFARQRDRSGEARARAYLAGALQIAEEHREAEREAILALPLLEHSPPYRASLLGLIALTHADRGEGEAAFGAASEALRILEELGGTVEGEALVRIAYAEGLRAKGDVEGSKKAIAAARDRLLARANQIENQEWRRGFLERLKEHRRTLQRAGEWLS